MHPTEMQKNYDNQWQTKKMTENNNSFYAFLFVCIEIVNYEWNSEKKNDFKSEIQINAYKIPNV